MGKKRAKRRRSPDDHHHRSSSKSSSQNLPKFPSYLDFAPNLPPKIHYLCEIIANSDFHSLEKTLNETRIFVTKNDVEHVLSLSYAFPDNAVRFFRWSGGHNQSRHAWNLVVDLLGKNKLFDAMWETIECMKVDGFVSLATFASVFGSYASAGREKDAIRAFDLMTEYGVPRDVMALNSLLSAMCREGSMVNAVEFMRIAKGSIRVDGDTFAILLEGWESQGNVGGAQDVFNEMVEEIGWDSGNVAAYDSFLIMLVKGCPGGLTEAMKSFEVLEGNGCYPGMRFLKVAMEECVKNANVSVGLLLWETLVGGVGLKPDTELYNSLIGLHCCSKNGEVARNMVDEMVCNGVFPDTGTYNTLLKFFISSGKLIEVSEILKEMIRNEFIPSRENCGAAIRVYLDAGDPYMAIKVWRCMVDNYSAELEEVGNFLVVGLHDRDRVQEASKYAGDMIDRGIHMNVSTWKKLQESLCTMGKTSLYDQLLGKAKTSDASCIA